MKMLYTMSVVSDVFTNRRRVKRWDNLQMKKDIISKKILKHIARDLSKHILKIEIKDDMELIDKEFTRVEKRDADLVFKKP